ncbi:MAG: O-antigen polymerase [Planctomycetota bacterium]
MTTLIAVYLVVLALAIGGFVLGQFLRGKHDLITTRNTFLFSIVFFQVTSAAFPLFHGEHWQYTLSDRDSVALRYAFMLTAFLAIFMVTYSWGPGVKRLARRAKTTVWDIDGGALIVLAVIAIAVGSALRFAVNIPLVGVLSNFIGSSMTAIGAGLAGWYWGRRMFNPAAITIAGGIVLFAIAVNLVGEFGRRPLVSAAGCFLFGAYFSAWRYRRPVGVLFRFAVAAIPALLLFGAFTSIRTIDRGAQGLGDRVQALRSSGNATAGLMTELDGQQTGTVSLWLVDHYNQNPEDVRPFWMGEYFLTFPIPRTIWTEKPLPLSISIPEIAGLRGVAVGSHTVGPGIMGHSAADGGTLPLIVYAVGFGLLFRYCDERLRGNPYSPLAVLPIGSTLGQLLGMARGETSIFLFIFVFSTFSVLFLMRMVATFFAPATIVRVQDVPAVLGVDRPEWEHEEPGDDEWYDEAEQGAGYRSAAT